MTTRTHLSAERTIELANGLHLRYDERGPQVPFAVVLVHGWPDSWRSFEAVLDAMVPGTRTVAVSLRGFGGSDAPANGYTPDDFASDVVDVIEQLGITRAVLVGHSMGSLVAQRIAVRRPDLVAGLVLVGAFTVFDRDAGLEVWSVIRDLTDPLDDAFVRDFQSSTLASPVDPGFFEQIVAESLRAPARVWREAFDAMRAADVRGELHRITAPTLLLWGSEDVLVARSQQELFLSKLTDVDLVEYDGLGHSPNWEQPARVANDIRAFVDRLGGV